MKKAPVSRAPVSFAAGLIALCVATHAAVVFQADFDSPSKIVDIGGKGSLRKSSHYTATVQTSDPLLDGGYLRIVNPHKAASGISSGVIFSPASPASSWASLHTGGKTSVLNGGADFFARVTMIDDTRGNSWFRPLDLGSTSDGGLRLIIESQGHDQLRIQLLGPKDSMVRENNFSTSVVTASGPFNFNAGDIAHIGFTFTTDKDDWITLNLFATKSSDPINTAGTSGRIASIIFKINPALVTTGLTSGRFSLNGGYLSETQNTLDFDQFRIYDATPTSFSGSR